MNSGHQEIKFEVQDWSNNISGVSEEIAKEVKKNEAEFNKIKATLQYKAEINLVEY